MSAYDTTQPTAPRMDLLDALIAGYVLSPADTPAVSANYENCDTAPRAGRGLAIGVRSGPRPRGARHLCIPAPARAGCGVVNDSTRGTGEHACKLPAGGDVELADRSSQVGFDCFLGDKQ